jgi:PAS domain S-box-containing protein
MFQLKSIRAKFIIAFLLISIVPTIAIASISIQNLENKLEGEVFNRILAIAEAKEGQIFAYLDGIESRTIDFASDGFIYSNFQSNLLSVEGTSQALADHLTNNKQTLDATIVDIHALGPKGIVFSATNSEEIGKDHSQEKSFISGLATTSSTSFYGHQSEEKLQEGIAVSTPIKDRQSEEVIGVLTNYFETSKLNKIISGEFQIEEGAITTFGASENIQIYLVDSTKHIFFQSEQEEIGSYSSLKIDTLPVTKCLENGEEVLDAYYSISQEPVLGSSMCIPDRGWTLIVEINKDIALAPIEEAYQKLAIFILILVLISILTAIYISSKITRPLARISQKAKEISLGNLDTKIKINSNDEIGDLSIALDTMINSFKEVNSQIGEKVEEQTKKIKEDRSGLRKQEKIILHLLEETQQEKKEAEEIAGELKKFKLSVDSVSDQITITDNEGKIIYVNPAVEKITGYSVVESLGTKAGMLWGGLMGKRYYKKLWKIVKEEKKIFQGTITNKKKDGTKFESAVSIHPILDQKGQVRFFVAVEQDITKELELDQMKTNFAALASHQINTPLSVIKWLAETLTNEKVGKLNKKQKELVQDIQSSSKSLIILLQDLLKISSLEAGNFKITKKKVSLSKLVKKEIKEFSHKLTEAKMFIETRFCSSIDRINTDPQLISEICQNLLSNAIKYGESGGKIIVTIEEELDKIIIHVKGDGIGISNDEQKKIFGRFYRAVDANKSDTDGNGIGLYFSRLVIELLGGKIWVESEKNKGATFSFSIPKK